MDYRSQKQARECEEQFGGFELFLRTGTEVLDTATYEAMPYTGPTLASVTPDTAMVGATVTIGGAGFGAGPLRVFFGGAEGAVTASTDTTITATVPTGALPGLVFVLVGDDSAVGMVPFLPLDTAGVAVPPPTRTKLYYVSQGTFTLNARVRELFRKSGEFNLIE